MTGMADPRIQRAMGVKRAHDPLSPAFVPPPRYGSGEWMRRHVAAGNVPVGVVRGCVIDYVRFGALPASKAGSHLTSGVVERKGVLCKVVGGSAEHPTVMAITPEEMKGAIWTVSRNGARRQTSATGDSAMTSPSADQGAGATPWIAGGLILGMAVAMKAAEVKMGVKT